MTELLAHKKYEFIRQLEVLRGKHGRGTELISLYIPHDKQISDVVAQLREEYGQASNIKSRLTRTNVQSALDSLMSRLKFISKIPENGVVIFCGAVDIGGSKTDMQTYIIEPPEPITSYKYHCDSSFYLQPLEDMLREKKTYGLVVLDRREATIGLLKGKRVEELAYLTSTVPGKQKKGGQSSHRFQQLRLIAINEFYTRIGNKASEIFLAIPREELEGILIGGPSPTKEEFEQGGYLHHEIQQKIIGLFDVAYTDESGLYELLDRSGEALAGLEVMKEKKHMERFMRELVSDSDLASYGEEQVRKNLQLGAVDTLLLSEDLRKVRVNLKCPACEYEVTLTRRVNGSSDLGRNTKETRTQMPGELEPEPGDCPRCGAGLKITEILDIVEELSSIADQMGSSVVFISTEFEEGEQLMNAFGGIAAILRFKTGV